MNPASNRVAAKTVATNRVAAKPTVTTHHFGRELLWASVAVAALLIAVLCGQSDIGAQRTALVLSSLKLRSAPADEGARPFDPQVATRQLAQAVRGLTEDHERLLKRVAAVEHDMDDMTGSITRESEAARAAPAPAPSPWPSDQAAPLTEADIAPLIVPPAPPAGTTMPPEAEPATPAVQSSPPQSQTDPAVSAPSATAYGVDLGGAHSFKSLRARWTMIHAAHPQLFEGLRPSATLKESARSNRTELRLVVGPFANASAAAQLCAALAAFRHSCQPTMFDGRLALQ
jgi:hypothetical protein